MTTGEAVPAGREATTPSRIFGVFPYVLLTGILLAFLIPTFNRYVPPQEGWFQYWVMLLRQGKVPYRDFYLHIQFPYLILMSWIDTIGDHTIIGYRIYGVVERLLLTCLVYGILRRMFPAAQVFIATLLGLFVYSSFNVDLPYSYYQTSMLLAVVSAVFVERSLIGRAHQIAPLLAAGLATGLAFFTRQSMGVLLLASYLLILTLFAFRHGGVRRTAATLAAFLVGFGAVALPVFGYLLIHGAFDDYLRIVYLATDSKGSVQQILFGFIPRTLDRMEVIPLLVPALFIAGGYLVRRSAVATRESRLRIGESAQMLIYALLALVAVSYAYSQPQMVGTAVGMEIFVFKQIMRHIVVFVAAGVFLAFVLFVMSAIRHRDDAGRWRVAFWLLFSGVWMYSHGMSGEIEAHALLLPLPLLLLIWWNSYSFAPIARVSQGLSAALGLVLITLIASRTFVQPYSWWGWAAPDVRLSVHRSTIPALRGMRLDATTVAEYDAIHAYIARRAKAGDEMFFFPHIAVFNAMTGLTNSAFAPVTYFDVCSDGYAQKTAQWLERRRPEWIAEMWMPEPVWMIHESYFRGGNRSSQREIAAALQSLAERGIYEQAIVIRAPNHYPIRILHRRTP